MDKIDKNESAQEYFESGDDPWETRYDGDDMEAAMYHDRLDAAFAHTEKYVRPNGHVLEIGCGSGILSGKLLKAGFDLTCCDFSLRMIDKTRSATGHTKLLVADANALPFSHHQFDAIIMIGVAAYISDLDGMLNSLHQFLKPRGKLIISSANKRLLLSAVSGKISRPLYALGIDKPESDPRRRILTERNRYYRASEFNLKVRDIDYEMLGSRNIGYGRIKIAGRQIFPDSFNIFVSRLITQFTRFGVFRNLGDYAFNNVACFRSHRQAT